MNRKFVKIMSLLLAGAMLLGVVSLAVMSLMGIA